MSARGKGRPMTESVALSFRDAGELEGVDKPLVHDLSAVDVVGRTLFAASDETATVERLILDRDGRCSGQHCSGALGPSFVLRSEKRRVGTGCGRTVRYRLVPYP